MAQLTESQQAFVDRFAPYANLASQQTGLPARVILGKLAIESNWGQNMYRNNIAGLKPGAAAQNEGSLGSGATRTFEDLAGGRTTLTDKFLQYATPEQGIGGFVNWLTNSGIPSINGLVDRKGGGIFAPDAAADTAAINALNASPFSTDVNLSRTLPQRVGMIPDLSKYGIASSFDPTLNRLAEMAPYQAGGTDYSRGAGDITSNNYWSGRRYQAQGEVLPREKGANGLELPSPEIGTTPQQLSALDEITNALTGSLRAGANLIGNRFVEATGRLPTADELQQRVDSLKSGATNVLDQLTGLAGSDEAKAFGDRTGLDPRQYVIQDAFRASLGRDATADDLAQNLGVLKGGGTLSDITRGIVNSQEGQNYQLGQFYQNAFGRDIDSAGLQNALNQLRAGSSLQALETQLLQGDEAKALGIDATQYASFLTPQYTSTLGAGTTQGTITNGGKETGTIGAPPSTSVINSLYEAILHRPGDTASLRAFDAELDSGRMDLNQIAQTMASSDEAKTLGPGLTVPTYSALDTIYARNLDRTADAQALDTWQNVNTQDGLSALEAAIYGSQEAQTFRAGLGDLANTIRAPDLTKTIGPTKEQTTTAWDGSAYLQANPDVAASGMDPLQHYLRYGQAEGRALNLSGQKFDGNAYLAANPDVAKAGLNPLDHFGRYGAQEGRLLGVVGGNAGQGLGSTTGFSGQDVSGGLKAGTGTFSGTFNPAEYLRANQDVASSGQDPLQHFLNYGVREGRAIDTLGNHFNGTAYLAANPDIASAGLDPLAHFLRFGAQEARTLAPTDWAQALTATTEVTPQGASWLTGTIGPGPTIGTIGPGPLTPTIGSGPTTPTIGSGPTVPTIGAGPITPSWSPGGGINNPYGFSGANVGGGLGATNQSFGSLWPVGTGGSTAGTTTNTGGGTVDPFGFTQANVGGFDVNALGGGGGGGGQGGSSGGPGVNEMGISGGFDAEGAMRRVLEQQAADLKARDQAAKTAMHSDPNAWNAAIANGGTLGLGTSLQGPGAMGGPTVPNITLTNLNSGAALGGMFMPWR